MNIAPGSLVGVRATAGNGGGVVTAVMADARNLDIGASPDEQS